MSDEEKRWPFDGFYLKLAEAQREYEQEQHIDPALLTEEERQQKLQEILDCIKASRKKKKEADEQLDPIVPEEEPETAGATPQPTKQYITDLVGEDYKNWHGIVVLDAGTNSGKTYFILKTLLPWTYPVHLWLLHEGTRRTDEQHGGHYRHVQLWPVQGF